ncbi:MAG TPA: hypothetical protein VHE35_26720, partial [Kofleriaceae bacterium]|nr:hypothetical protein [Kofleriaceae bacterium]
MRRAAACAMALVGLGGCDGASPDPGLDALLQVDGAQFRPGPFPADEGGPAAVMVAARRAELVVGHTGGSLHGAVAPAARVAVLGLDGVDGTWLVPAGVPDLETPDLASVRATFAVADDFPPGPFTLSLAAAGADGRFGAPATTMIVADAEEPPAGELVVALAWDG